MPARTLAYRLLVISPIIYVGAIVVRARLYIDPYAFTSCTAKQQEAFLAYRDVFAEAAGFQGLPASQVDHERLRVVASRWVEGAQSGQLRPLTPVHLDDYSRDGVKQQISRVRDVLSQRLLSCAKEELENKQPVQAAKDVLMAIRVTEAMKYSDPYSVSHSGMMQRTLINFLPRIADHLKPAERLWIRAQLKEIREQQQPLEPMARLIARLYREKSAKGQFSDIETLDALLKDPSTADSRSVTYLASLPKPSEMPTVKQSAYIGLLRMCGTSQAMWLRHLDGAIEDLNELLASVAENPKGSHVASITP